MAGAAKPKRKAPAAAKGHKLPEPIPEGLEIVDTIKKGWKIGPKIGSGGFGTVYFASAAGKNQYDYVVKVEYHDNGPLFAEMHCYQNIGKPAHLSEWVKKKNLPYLGLSPCYGFGSFEYQNSKYRFMIIERFDQDLQKLFEESGRRFPAKTVYSIGISLLTVLEYIHSAGYIHGDIKAANLLLGRKKGTENQVYLVDMGLACKYLRNGAHKKEQFDPKKAHNGTPEFTSRDAHRGCFSRRTDIEILCYNLLQWLAGELPWEKLIPNNKRLQKEKERCMGDIPTFLEVLFPKKDCPVGIRKLLTYVSKMKFEDEPDYDLCRSILKDELKRIGSENDSTLDFANPSKKNATPSTKEPTSNKENAKKSNTAQEKRKPEPEVSLEPGMIPTPAMLEIMRRRAEDVKPTKTPRRK